MWIFDAKMQKKHSRHFHKALWNFAKVSLQLYKSEPRCCGARVDKIFTGLATNQTAVFQATIYSYNLKGRSERVTLPKMTLDAEECCHAAVSHHCLVELPNFDIDTAMNMTKHSDKGFMYNLSHIQHGDNLFWCIDVKIDEPLTKLFVLC